MAGTFGHGGVGRKGGLGRRGGFLGGREEGLQRGGKGGEESALGGGPVKTEEDGGGASQSQDRNREGVGFLQVDAGT